MKRVALIGKPLRRRHSEIMHNAAFREYGVDARYELREIEPEQVRDFVSLTRGEDWFGFQITAPYKQVVMEHLDEIDPLTERIGAVNSVARLDDGRLEGFNTDAPGFIRSLEADLDLEVRGKDIAVAGAGGAARAVVNALAAAGANRIVIGNRTPDRAEGLAREFGRPVEAATLGEEFERALAGAQVAVNATTLGMVDEGVAFDVHSLPATAAVYDLVYTPPETRLLREARLRGLKTANGLGMLITQAEIALERWTGIPGAGEVMAAALEADIGHP